MLSARDANRTYFQDAYRTGVHGWAVDVPSAYALEFLADVSRRVPGGRLLDIGCGEGRHSFAAAAMGFHVAAVDYEPLALKRARRIARARRVAGITFRAASVFHLPFRDSSFDVVLDYGCLHHQRKADWPSYKSNLLRVLKPAGFYILSTFSPRFRFFQGSAKPWHIARGAYRRYFTRKDFSKFLDQDFEILEMVEERGGNGGFWHLLTQRR